MLYGKLVIFFYLFQQIFKLNSQGEGMIFNYHFQTIHYEIWKYQILKQILMHIWKLKKQIYMVEI